jgi:lipopolysaccharide biosynthesis glycosyltransferase
MKKNFALVTGADKKYLPFLKQLLNSIIKHNVYRYADIFIFSINLDKKYFLHYKPYIKKICNPNFTIKLNFNPKNEWTKLLTERPYIKDYFPGYKKYIWLDADTCFLNKHGIKDLVTACENHEISIAPEISPSYIHTHNSFGIKHFFHSLYKINGWSFKNYKNFFSRKIAETLIFKPLFNNGVFCLDANSTLWSQWKKNYKSALLKCFDEYGLKTDQLSLNVSLIKKNKRIGILDPINNWIYKFSKPHFNKKESKFYTPDFPRREINIIHFTGLKYQDSYKKIFSFLK